MDNFKESNNSIKNNELFITRKADKIYSLIKKNYLQYIQSYSQYCKEKNSWFKKTQYFVDSIDNYNADNWLFLAGCWDKTALLLKKLAENCSFDELRELMKDWSGMEISIVSYKVMKFSPYGLSFIENVVKPLGVLDIWHSFAKEYEEEKNKEAQLKTELTSRLGNVLKMRIYDLQK